MSGETGKRQHKGHGFLGNDQFFYRKLCQRVGAGILSGEGEEPRNPNWHLHSPEKVWPCQALRNGGRTSQMCCLREREVVLAE